MVHPLNAADSTSTAYAARRTAAPDNVMHVRLSLHKSVPSIESTALPLLVTHTPTATNSETQGAITKERFHWYAKGGEVWQETTKTNNAPARQWTGRRSLYLNASSRRFHASTDEASRHRGRVPESMSRLASVYAHVQVLHISRITSLPTYLRGGKQLVLHVSP